MSLEWKTLEIPLDYAKEVYRVGGEIVDERTITSGSAKAGSQYNNGYFTGAYILSLYFNNIPQWLKTCYIRMVYTDYKGENTSTRYVEYRKKDEKWEEFYVNKTIYHDATGCTIYTGEDDYISAGSSGKFAPTEGVLQNFVSKGNIVNRISGFYNLIDNDWLNIATVEIADVSKLTLTIEYAKAPVNVIPIYPVDVYFKNTQPIEISWKSKIEVYKEPSIESALYKKSDDILYIDNTVLELWNDAGVRAEHILTSSSNVYTVSLDELSSFGVGDLYYKITSTTNDDVEGYTTSKCILIGETSAPDITGHTNNSFPTISWNCDNQAAWQMIVKQGDEVFLNTGIKPGNDQEYKLPILLDDGNYSVEIRAVNTVGVYTAWNSYLMILNTVKPSAPNGIIVSANNKFGIIIKCNIPDDAGTLYVMKRKDSLSKAEIVGEYKENFTDYKIELNESYEYTVRNYVTGCADGAWVDAVVNAEGVVIRKENDYVHLFMAETEFDVIKADERDNTLSKCVGRTFPVLEIGEWVTSTRRVGGCVSNDNYKLLVDMSLNGSVMLQSNKEVIPCYMRVADMGKHVSGGRLVELVFTRIDGE